MEHGRATAAADTTLCERNKQDVRTPSSPVMQAASDITPVLVSELVRASIEVVGSGNGRLWRAACLHWLMLLTRLVTHGRASGPQQILKVEGL